MERTLGRFGPQPLIEVGLEAPRCDDGPVAGHLLYQDLVAKGVDAGLHLVGTCEADPFDHTRQVLEQRRAEGLAGTMQFTYRNPARSTDPAATMVGARTLLVGARSYHRDPPPAPAGQGPVARVARYVWADDQQILLDGLGAMAAALRDAGHQATVLSDQNNLVDRAVAHRAGIGWFGRNSNLLLPGRGSWYLLGAVLTDAGAENITGLPIAAPIPDGCGTCTRCEDACPTGAIVAPGVVDARRCLSWSLQTTGSFPREHRIALGDRIYGCDDCQEVCPPNRRELRRAGDTQAGESVPTGDQDRAWVRILDLLAATDEELMARHGRWYIARRDPAHLRRNALVVLGNIGDGEDPEIAAAIRAAAEHPSAVVRAHAVWAARRLGRDDLVSMLATDPDPEVRAEMDAPHPPTRRAS